MRLATSRNVRVDTSVGTKVVRLEMSIGIEEVKEEESRKETLETSVKGAEMRLETSSAVDEGNSEEP